MDASLNPGGGLGCRFDTAATCCDGSNLAPDGRFSVMVLGAGAGTSISEGLLMFPGCPSGK